MFCRRSRYWASGLKLGCPDDEGQAQFWYGWDNGYLHKMKYRRLVDRIAVAAFMWAIVSVVLYGNADRP